MNDARLEHRDASSAGPSAPRRRRLARDELPAVWSRTAKAPGFATRAERRSRRRRWLGAAADGHGAFCGIAGYTETGEAPGTERVSGSSPAISNDARAGAGAARASVEKFIGDAVDGAFGSRQTDEDDAYAPLARRSSSRTPSQPFGLKARIGINIGEVVEARRFARTDAVT